MRKRARELDYNIYTLVDLVPEEESLRCGIMDMCIACSVYIIYTSISKLYT